jgi:hypothetical protein
MLGRGKYTSNVGYEANKEAGVILAVAPATLIQHQGQRQNPLIEAICTGQITCVKKVTAWVMGGGIGLLDF